MVFVRKLSGLRCLKYHAIYTNVTGGMSHQPFLHGLKSHHGVLDINYQVCGAYITMLCTHQLPVVCFRIFFARVQITTVFSPKL